MLTAALSFLVGLLGGNAAPHFLRGLVKENYPCVFGHSPVPNFLAGWVGLVVAALLAYYAHMPLHPVAAFASVAIGVLLIGLFHAKIGAFGRKDG